ncbi:alkaline phosphatase PhoX [Phycicoccus duodecadis]|uniref:Uncharacterized protein DUF839 n=1 Tax=Phycicoccus duodecadis TaxID=173053 RepID=A0A2N3YLM4_9MICO|nr:alkaline phosphatase PhoX [Phycicoccus duodecadis]PKW27708.1 uncharacterized protein DUF839 [Phycicoccus duodecadis]
MLQSPLAKATTCAALAAVAVGAALVSSPAQADSGFSVAPVPYANPRVGVENNVLTPSARQVPVAWGALPLTNPDAANGVTHYGYNTTLGGPLTQAATEANKTEPDKNVYLVFGGHHYLYQGHEAGPRGYVTRIDLDQTDPTKRVTLVSDVDSTGAVFPTIDGMTWDPFSHQLLLTAESGAPNGGVFGVSLDGQGDAVDGKATRLTALGSGGYEGIQNDGDGNVWLVEDIGGAAAAGGKAPNSYVYRFRPADRTDLTAGGTLQALQIQRADGTPVLASQLQADPSDAFIASLHTQGTSFRTRWVDVSTGTSSVAATAGAAAAGATPLKRPENGVFRPGTDFREFYFTETGDTSTSSTLPGAYGGVFRIAQKSAGAETGTISLVTGGDQEHTGFDNITFAARDSLLVVEDAGDGLHQQRNALDSGYVIDLGRGERRGAAPSVVRFLAEGRDASATFDAAGGPKYNDGDNEITGIHVSDGDPTPAGILGAKLPNVRSQAWRTFWTQQHGDNVTWEITWDLRAGHDD